MLKEGQIRIPSGCAIAAIIDRKGGRIKKIKKLLIYIAILLIVYKYLCFYIHCKMLFHIYTYSSGIIPPPLR